jgi:hypothetical protein
MTGILLLTISAALIAMAIWYRMSGSLLTGISAFTLTALYITKVESTLVVPTLALAIGLGLLAVLRTSDRQPHPLEPTR